MVLAADPLSMDGTEPLELPATELEELRPGESLLRARPTIKFRISGCVLPTAPDSRTIAARADSAARSSTAYGSARRTLTIGNGITWSECLVLVPESGSRTAYYLDWWELITTLLVIVCAYLIPISLALPTVGHDLQLLSFFLDVAFTLDVIGNFFLAYRLPAYSKSDRNWERDLGEIARRYCAFPLSEKGQAGRFWIDVMSIMPGWLGLFSKASFLQAARCMRLTRMERLTRLNKKIEERQAKTGIPYFVSDIMKFIFVATFVSHSAACVWVMIEGTVTTSPFFERNDSGKSWLSALISAKGDCCIPDAEHDPLCVYNLALYWAMMTLTSVGYGDITPQVPLEYAIATLVMLIAGFVWAYIVGSVVSLLSQIDPDNAHFKQSLDKLNTLMDHRALSPHLRSELREYMMVARSVERIQRENQLLHGHISNGLQRQVVLQTPVMKTLLQKVYWARHLEQDALLEIMRSLRGFTYSKGETIPIKGRMILVRDGLLAVKGRILGRNQVYGENAILLSDESLVDESMPRTLSYSTVLVLTKQNLMEACEQYPSADIKLRRAQIRTALWRGFVLAARKRRSTFRRRISKGIKRFGFVASLSGKIASAVTYESLVDMQSALSTGHDDINEELAEVQNLLAEEMKCLEKLKATHSASPHRSRFFRSSV